jgi:hypothetical protein
MYVASAFCRFGCQRAVLHLLGDRSIFPRELRTPKAHIENASLQKLLLLRNFPDPGFCCGATALALCRCPNLRLTVRDSGKGMCSILDQRHRHR